jgi:predicted DCC family thiol-disulfide oxidoreductase YuxK
MISLITEMTDAKGRRARRGWVCFDRECATCAWLARCFRPALEKRGFGLAALQDPRVALLFGMPVVELLQEMRVVTSEEEFYGGANAVVYLARQIRWAWPVYALSRVPGMRRLLRGGYRWFAAHRRCASNACVAAPTRHQDS